MKDNRKHARVHSRLRCWCEGENVTVYARIGNLSEGGLFLRTSTPLEQGSKAVVRLAVGDRAEFEANATVVWSRLDEGGGPPGMGLRFEDLEPAKLEQIRRIIQGEQASRMPGDS